MRINGETDPEDWSVVALLWHMKRPRCWSFSFTPKDWKWGLQYFWYDGPHWVFHIGPIVIVIDDYK